MSTEVLVWEVPSTGLSFRLRLLSKENPIVIQKILAQLPMHSTLAHTVVSGEGIWTNTRVVDTGFGNMVKRHPGTVYFMAPGQMICITYGATTESALVNKFAEVFKEDLGRVKDLGRIVYQKTITQARRELVKVILRREEDTREHQYSPADYDLPRSLNPYISNWRQAVVYIQREIDRVWLEEPEEITRIKFGVIDSGMGTFGQSFSVLVHLEIFLMMDGAHILYRLLMDSEDKEAALGQIIRTTHRHLMKPFDHFEFLSDLGLARMKLFGDMYFTALGNLSTLDEYRELTAAFFTLVARMYHWIHHIFPWNLGAAFPHRMLKEMGALAKL